MPDLGATSRHIISKTGNLSITAAATTAAAHPLEKYSQLEPPHKKTQQFNQYLCNERCCKLILPSLIIRVIYCSISAQNDYVNCPVDPGSIQGSHWPVSLTTKYMKNTRERLVIQLICEFS